MQKSLPTRYFQISRYTAAHEAGHAIASCRVGHGFRAVHATPMADVIAGKYILDQRDRKCFDEGFCETVDNFNWHRVGFGDHMREIDFGNDCQMYDPYEDIRAGARQSLVILAAGAIAEAKFRHMSVHAVMLCGGSGDWEEMKAIAKFVADNDADKAALLNEAEAQAKALFRDKETWQAVLELAELIQVHGTVTSEMAEPITSRLN